MFKKNLFIRILLFKKIIFFYIFFRTDFHSNQAHGLVYWASPEGDLAFAGMNTNACDHTTCPITKDTRKTYSYVFATSKKYPAVKKNVKKDQNIYFNGHYVMFTENL